MSPLTHGMIGWLSAQPLKQRRDRILVTAAGLLPDLDGLGLVVSTEYYAKFHHTFGHNIFFGILLSLLFMRFSAEKLKVAVLTFLSFNLHVLCDLLGSGTGWGVPYFWPLNEKVFEFSHPFQWEINGWQNLVVTGVCIVLIVCCSIIKKRTIVEVVSTDADKKVVKTFNSWLGKRI